MSGRQRACLICTPPVFNERARIGGATRPNVRPAAAHRAVLKADLCRTMSIWRKWQTKQRCVERVHPSLSKPECPTSCQLEEKCSLSQLYMPIVSLAAGSGSELQRTWNIAPRLQSKILAFRHWCRTWPLQTVQLKPGRCWSPARTDRYGGARIV